MRSRLEEEQGRWSVAFPAGAMIIIFCLLYQRRKLSHLPSGTEKRVHRSKKIVFFPALRVQYQDGTRSSVN